MTASIKPIISPVIPCTVPSINAHAAESFISAPPMLLFVTAAVVSIIPPIIKADKSILGRADISVPINAAITIIKWT